MPRTRASRSLPRSPGVRLGHTSPRPASIAVAHEPERPSPTYYAVVRRASLGMLRRRVLRSSVLVVLPGFGFSPKLKYHTHTSRDPPCNSAVYVVLVWCWCAGPHEPITMRSAGAFKSGELILYQIAPFNLVLCTRHVHTIVPRRRRKRHKITHPLDQFSKLGYSAKRSATSSVRFQDQTTRFRTALDEIAPMPLFSGLAIILRWST